MKTMEVELLNGDSVAIGTATLHFNPDKYVAHYYNSAVGKFCVVLDSVGIIYPKITIDEFEDLMELN